ncbi:hypothetical protein GY45DRAFT_1328572 [Cubamyces sp. BRFM 1775]|nr:hypothetical protein GY45DRAFT_1328572 [Cubamyces sp. BRFM 1775]
MSGSSAARLLPRQTSNGTSPDGCLICSDAEPNCDCAWDQHCIVISRDCDTCPSTQCVDDHDNESPTGTASTSGKSSVSKGTVAAAVVVPILALIAVASVFYWLRRRRLRLQQHSTASTEQTPKPGLDLLTRANNLTFQAPIYAAQFIEKPQTPPPVHHSFPIVHDEPRRSAQETVYRARAAASAPSLRSTTTQAAPLPIKPPSHKTTASISQNSSTSSVVPRPLPLPSRRTPPKAVVEKTSTKAPPSSYTTSSDGSSMRKRASLDTLALTSDLSKYPLGFDSADVPALPPTPVSLR